MHTRPDRGHYRVGEETAKNAGRKDEERVDGYSCPTLKRAIHRDRRDDEH